MFSSKRVLGAPKRGGVRFSNQKVSIPRNPSITDNKAINYPAAKDGCGYWRMDWPAYVLGAFGDGIISTDYKYPLDHRYYNDLRSIRLQRPITQLQLDLIKAIKPICERNDIKLIYEVDDIIFGEDIPDYNVGKKYFVSDSLRRSSKEIMLLCDEVSVTCQALKDYYHEKTGHPNITTIPNYAPKFWIDRFYEEERIRIKYKLNKKRPRVLWGGSVNHLDIDNNNKGVDDFSHVLDVVKKTKDKFKWCFLGHIPRQLKPFVRTGEIEQHPWRNIVEYPQSIAAIKPNAVIAPLADNVFNRCKSNIKYLEAGCFGIPGVFQDLCTYEDAPLRFNTGDEMIAQLENLFKDEDFYMRQSKACRGYAETMWLELPENREKYKKLYRFD